MLDGKSTRRRFCNANGMEQTNKHFFLLSTMTGCRTAYAKGLLGYEALLTQGLGFCPVLTDTHYEDEIN